MIHQWPSPAKLNLFLYITGRRADGYHQLQTLFQFLDYGDTLTIVPRQDDQIQLLTPVEGVPDEQNLIVRAARLLQQHCTTHSIATLPRGQTSASTSVCRWVAALAEDLPTRQRYWSR